MNDLIDRQAAIEAIEEMQMPIMRSMFPEEQFVFKGMSEALSAIKDLPSAQPDSKETSSTHKALDTISRQAAIRWVKTECNPYGKPTLDFESGKKVIEHLKQMPSAQPEPCGDVVSRNAIVQKLNEMDRYVSTELRLCDTDKKFPQNEVFIVDDVYEGIVEQLPSAQPPIQTASNYLQSLPTSPLLIGKMPSAQPEISCSETPNTSDTISRQAAIDANTRDVER